MSPLRADGEPPIAERVRREEILEPVTNQVATAPGNGRRGPTHPDIKRIDIVGYLTVEAEGDASEPGDVRCGIPGFDHPGTELHGDTLRSTDPALRCQVTGRRHAAFTTDFDYRSVP